MDKKKKFYVILIAAIFAVLVIFMTFDLFNGNTQLEYIGYNEFLQMAEEGNVEEITLSDNAKITFTANGGTYETDNPRNPQLKETLLLLGIAVNESSASDSGALLSTVLTFVFFAGAIFFASRILKRQGGGAVMAIDVKDSTEKTGERMGFEDVAGNEEAKESVQDIVDFIKDPGKYARYGARMPRGVIFYGPPGTGKTLMAKAIAGEAGVPFFAVSGSDFVQMYVGVGASRVRALFKKAREAGNAVIFIDEIDALAKKRGGVSSGGNDERDQTLNALLTEMSGFEPNKGIVVIAATNRLDTLDEALLRPGRFDRRVEIGLPDLTSRERILNLHSKNKPVSQNINISDIARQTVYFSGAMLENLMNEAAIAAARKGSEAITENEVEEAYYTIVAGKAKKDRSGIKEHERRITAFHEAGHALAAKIKAPENSVAKITIIPSTRGAGGFCLNIPPDKLFFTKSELESQVMVSLAGRAAEELIFGEENVTTGAANDLIQAASAAKDIVSKYGMCKTAGLLPVGESEISREQASLIERLYKDTCQTLSKHTDTLKRIANALLLKETINESELDKLISSEF